MKINFYLLLFLHLLLGVLASYLSVALVLYPFLIILLGLVYVIYNKNNNNEVLIVAAYIAGVEVFLRMSGAVFLYETGKYGVLLFMLLGIYLQGIDKRALIYFIVLIFLIPGLVISMIGFENDLDIRKSIIFNLLGPVVLLVSTFYTFGKQITKKQLYNILLAFGLPLVSMLVYVILYKPVSEDLFTVSSSNFDTSGGFGPNQVSTMLGFGMFVFFSLFLFFSKSFLQRIVFIALSLLFGYRCLLTFSRGGLIAAILMIIVLLGITYINVSFAAKLKLKAVAIVAVFIGFLIFSYSILLTGGMITNRYTGKDTTGREKEKTFAGREDIAGAELQIFKENPVFGVGVGRGKIVKSEILGREAAAHNEITRLLAEHGSFGLLAFLIMFFTPLVLFMFNRNQLFIIPFFLFWFLTINHAALRIVAPAFVYALALIKVNWREET